MTSREWFPVSSQRLRFSATGLICLVREYSRPLTPSYEIGFSLWLLLYPMLCDPRRMAWSSRPNLTLGAWRGRADRIVCFSGFIPAGKGGESPVMCKIVDLCFPVQFLFPLPILQPFPAVWLSVCCGAATTVRPRRTLSLQS